MPSRKNKPQLKEKRPALGPPRILLSDEHPINLGMIDADALMVLRKLQEAGFHGYLVGGGVRDLYLGKTPKDFDISTNAHPGQIRKIFRNSMTIGRRFRLVQVFFHNGKIIEVSTLRSLDEHDLDGPEMVLAPNNTFGSLEEDAQRRDLTINSLFYEIEHNTIIDYVGGIDDLNHQIVRIVGDPDKRISRDPVRMLRAIRHAARINFTIEPLSWQSICRHHHELALCPPSRLRDELFKDLHSGSLLDWFNLAADSGLFGSMLGLYKEILAKPADDLNLSCRQQLTSLFTVVDRVTKKMTAAQIGQRLPNEFLLALLLLPWAACRFDFISQEMKGSAAFQFSKQLRASLDEKIGTQLNLPRTTRQEIVSFIGNLPLFIQHQAQDTWPQWLTRKSYFKNCLLFFHFYQESGGGLPVPDSLLDIVPPPMPIRHPRSGSREKRSSRPGSITPAFASDAPGGIFGFKKKPLKTTSNT